MKKFVVAITAALIILPLCLLFYKSQVLGLSMVPQMVDDIWNFHITLKPKGSPLNFSFPIPRPGPDLKIGDEKIRAKDLQVFIDTSSDSTIATWSSKEPIKRKIFYSARMDTKPVVIKKVPKDFTQNYPKGLQKYLRMEEISPEDDEALKSLEGAILEGNEDKTSLARKIYYYIDEEVQRQYKIKSFEQAIRMGKASPLLKAKLFNVMARRQKIPSRIVVMVRMPTPKEIEENEKIRFTYANEVFLGSRWVPVDTNRGYFAERPDDFLVIHRNYEEVSRLFSKKNVTYKIHAEQAMVNRFNRVEYKKEIMRSDSIFSKLSLYRLPLPMQTMFMTILLIPLGTLVLALARNIIGIPTFGIFTPILLTLFFKETSFGFGLVFFMVVILVGIGERYILDKFYLLAVPRLSIILTLVILLMLTYSLSSGDFGFNSQKHLAFFPIVIVTSNIERLSIMIAEEGLFNTMKTLVGTLVIAILGYTLYLIPTLELFMFTNPELLLTVIGFLILIGKYKGYRLSEFLRFYDLVRQKNKKMGEGA